MPPSIQSETAVLPSSGETPKSFEAGTLRYTRAGLLFLFFWLLWGDFAFTFFEAIFTRFIPLYLKTLHASDLLIGVMTGSFAGAVNILFLPGISRWSDNYRSPRGRRIPFLYIFTPLTVASLAGIGFAPEIGAGVQWVLDRMSLSLPPGSLVLPLLLVFVISFHFLNMVLVNAYNWLLRDVVPLDHMARFLSWFRIVSSVSTCLFLWYVFPGILTHRREVCGGIGLFYLVSFFLMCRNVKEGEYPPPEPPRANFIQTFILYFRDCLSIPIYRNFFIVYILVILASACSGPFTLLFYQQKLGISLDDMGHVMAYSVAAAALLYYPIGWLCDRFSPFYITTFGLAGLALQALCIYLFVHDASSYLRWSLVFAFPTVAWALGSLTASMRLFPKAEFGQFSSGLNVFGCGAMLFGNYLAGLFMELVHSDYRLINLWSATFAALALYPMILVVREWKRRGGRDAYVAPLPALRASGNG